MKEKSYARRDADAKARPASLRAGLARVAKLPPGVAIFLMLAISAVLWLVIVRFGAILWRMA